jgi:hypothetical protein
VLSVLFSIWLRVAYCGVAMHADQVLEVDSAVVRTFDGEPHEVHGGAYLTPEAYLRTTAALEQLHQRQLADRASTVPMLVVGAALLGLAAGYWFGGRSDE